jgi:low affinity Fe/Cu permease
MFARFINTLPSDPDPEQVQLMAIAPAPPPQAPPSEKNGKGPRGPLIPPRQPDLFARVAAWTARASGSRWAFLIAMSVVVVWALSGPFFRFSELWQLVINTGTTIVTFLMVFLIQNAQNRESKAVHLKLDELIFAVKQADNQMIDIENLTEEQLDQIAARYRKFARRYRDKLEDVAREVGHVEHEVGHVDHKVGRVEQRVEKVERKVDEERRPCPEAPSAT